MANIYVATTGNDTTGDGTIELPYRTIQNAANLVNPGDTVFIREGTYQEKVRVTRSGTAVSRITFRGYQDEAVVLDGQNTGDSNTGSPFQVGHVEHKGYGSYITVERIKVINGLYAGIRAHHAVSPIFRYIESTGNYRKGIVFHGEVTDGIIEYCRVYGNGDIGIYCVNDAGRVPGRVSNPIVRYNLVYTNGANESYTSYGEDADGINLYRLAPNQGGEVAYNIVWGNLDDGIDPVRNTSGVHIHHNIVFAHRGPKTSTNGDGNGVKLDTGGDSADTWGASGGHTVDHNIIFGNYRGGTDYDPSVAAEPAHSGNNIYNNTIYQNGYAAVIHDSSTRTTKVSTFRNNIYMENGKRQFSPNGKDIHNTAYYNTIDGDYNFLSRGIFATGNGSGENQCVEGAHSLMGSGTTGDPLFVDPYVVDWDTGSVANNSGELDVSWKGNIEDTLESIRSQVEAAFTLQSIAGGYEEDSPCLGTGTTIPGITDSTTMGALGFQQPPEDETAPTVVITSPETGFSTTDPRLRFTGTSEDPGTPSTGVNRVEISVNGDSWATASGTTAWGLLRALRPGANLVSVRAIDNFGNVGSATTLSGVYIPGVQRPVRLTGTITGSITISFSGDPHEGFSGISFS